MSALSRVYLLPERIMDLDAVTEILYENGNLAEEVYRAVGGDALPFYTMLGDDPLANELREAATGYLEELARVFSRVGVYGSSGSVKVKPRELVIERLTPSKNGPRPVFRVRSEVTPS